MTYNQTKVNGVAMPLLMGCTEPTAIEVAEDEPKVLYNPITQIVEIECGRAVGTKCLKTSCGVSVVRILRLKIPAACIIPLVRFRFCTPTAIR